MKVVIGVDSGGSKTRAIAVSLDGRIVGYGESGGGNPSHDSAYCENIRAAILGAAQPSGAQNVVRLVAGIAGFDQPSDREWAEKCTYLPGLSAPAIVVNDADIAHYGAFGGGSGIVSIQGDGSMVYARTDTGRSIRNFDFRHYARAAGPWFGSHSVLVLLARGAAPLDAAFVANVLKYWQVDSLPALHELFSRHSDLKSRDLLRKQGDMAPLVTQAAEEGSPLARFVCDEGVTNVSDGIRLVGRMFEGPDVPVALIGSCIRSKYMRRRLESRLAQASEKRYTIVDPAYSPVSGAVLMAFDAEGVQLADAALHELRNAD